MKSLPFNHDHNDQNSTFLQTAWGGHREFANWLVEHMQPETILELGIDYGFSTFSFAERGIGTVYAIDWFGGDAHAGTHDEAEILRRHGIVMDFKNKHSVDNLHILKMKFEDALPTWDKPVDILHIDGEHHYDSVKKDFQNWSPFVKENGIILFHDVEAHRGVTDLFNEIEGWEKLWFSHSAGLGIISKNADLLRDIQGKFPEVHQGNKG